MMRKAVDLPHPDGPSSERNSPGRTSRSRPASARVPFAKFLLTARNATSGAVEVVDGGSDIATPACGHPRIKSMLQIQSDFLVHELRGVGLTVVEIGFGDTGTHHLVKEILHARVGHGADAERLRIAGIDDAVFSHLG